MFQPLMILPFRSVILPLTCLYGPSLVMTVHAEVYLSEEKAVQILFPGLIFTSESLQLTSTEQEKIKSLSGERVRTANVRAWKSKNGSWVFIDRVLGKHEYITFALGIDSQGKVKGVEILEYRESYGHEVRSEKWRAQFVDKDASSTLRLDQDINNISGATLSSDHLTAGVRRILRTHAVIKSRI